MRKKTFFGCLFFIFLAIPVMTPFSKQGLAKWPEKRDLASSPEDFRKRGKEIQDEIKQNGGFALAGQVVEKVGQPMKKGTYVILLDGATFDYFENGWFISSRKAEEKPVKFTVQALQHNQVEISPEIEQGKINFQRISVDRTVKAERATLKGHVRNERGRPVANARILLRKTREYDPKTGMETMTDARGNYAFVGIPSQQYYMSVIPKVFELANMNTGTFKSLSYSRAAFQVRPGDDPTKLVLGSSDLLTRQEKDVVVTTVLFPRIVTIEMVYQPDGSTDFTKNNVTRNTYMMSLEKNEWNVMGEEKIHYWLVFNQNKHADSNMYIELIEGKYSFTRGFSSGSGLYSLGKVNFNSVKRADPDKIQIEDVPCELNHVYVARAHRAGGYAKFVVRSIKIVESLEK